MDKRTIQIVADIALSPQKRMVQLGELAAPSFWRGNGLTIKLGVFSGEDPVDMDNVTSITCSIRSSQTNDTVLAEKTDAAPTTIADADEWAAGNEQSAIFDFSEAELNLDTRDQATRTLWMVFSCILSNGTVRTLAGGEVVLIEDNDAAADPPAENPGVAITVDEADARYLKLSDIPTTDLADFGSGNATLGYAPLADGAGNVTWGPVASSTAWGNITGTLSDQTDLQNALNGKSDTSHHTWDSLTGTVTSIPFNTSPSTIPTTAGSVYWNADGETLEIVQDANGNSITVGGEIKVLKARNVSGVQILDGRAVYVSGEAASKPSIALASVTDVTHITSTIGIASETIDTGSNGKVTTFGMVSNLDTSALTAGQPVYLQSNGTYNHTVTAIRIGWVMVQSNGNGKIFVSVARMKWYSADILDASAGGNGAADADKLVKFDSAGGITAASDTGTGITGTNSSDTTYEHPGGKFTGVLVGSQSAATDSEGFHSFHGSASAGDGIGIRTNATIERWISGITYGTVPFDSFQTSSFTALAGHTHATIGTVTVTDPATIPATTQWFRVSVLSGTAVIGGVTYQASRFPIIRFSNAGGAWATVPPYLTDALDIASGARATTRTNLGAGAVGDTLFTAATVAAALGALQMQTLAPTGDVVVTSNATPANVAGMSFAVAANTTYVVACLPNIDAGAGGYVLRLSVPSLLNGGHNQNGYGMRVSGAGVVGNVAAFTGPFLDAAARGAAQTGPEFSIFAFTAGATPGTANFQFAQNSSNVASSTLLASTRAFIIRL